MAQDLKTTQVIKNPYKLEHFTTSVFHLYISAKKILFAQKIRPALAFNANFYNPIFSPIRSSPALKSLIVSLKRDKNY